MNCATVIARKGSTRVVGKNKRIICGQPLTYWTLKVALCSKLVDMVVLATDDQDLAELGLKMGAEIYWREGVTNDDPGWVPFLQVMEWLEKRDIRPATFANLFPTTPCKLPDDVDRAILRYQEGDCPNVMWAVHKREHTPMHALTNLDGQMKYVMGCIVDKGFHFAYDAGYGNLCDGPMYVRLTQVAAYKEGVVQPWYGVQGATFVYPWQATEIDIENDVEDAELMLSAKILKPYGVDVYDRYKAGEWTPPERVDIRKLHGLDPTKMFLEHPLE